MKSSDIKKYISVKLFFQGLHSWPEAPDEAGHLKDNHGHNFSLEACIEVKHADREVEFFLFRNFLKSTLDSMYPKSFGMSLVGMESCEMVAEKMIKNILARYGDRYCQVRVNEDEMQGGIAICQSSNLL